MKKSQIKEIIKTALEERFAFSKSTVNESLMGDIDIVAQESDSFESFLRNVKADPDFKMADIYDPEVKTFLQGVWDDAVKRGDANGGAPIKEEKNKLYYKNIAFLDKKGLTNNRFSDEDIQIANKMLSQGQFKLDEANDFKSGKEFINIKLQKYPKALTKVNELITMIGESKFTMEMAEWLFEFFNNASFERPVSESKRVS